MNFLKNYILHFLAHIHAKDTNPTLICHCVYDDILLTYDDTNDNDDDNDTRRTNHDYIGSLACMPNEPKSE